MCGIAKNALATACLLYTSFTERNGIYIIDLQKTVRKLEEAYMFVLSLIHI